MEEREETSLGNREKASLERRVESYPSTCMEGDESQGVEKDLETSMGEGLGASPTRLGLNTTTHTHTELSNLL